VFRALEPRPATVDGAILVLVGFEVLSGLASLLVGTPDWGWLFVVHAVAGLSLVVLVGWKLRRVWPRLRVDRRPDHVASSILLSVLAIAALATGIAWATGDPVRIRGYTLLTVHMVLGLLVVPVLVWHLRYRFRLPTRRDVEGRRTALQFAATVGAAALAWRFQGVLARVAGLLSVDERFTGSKRAGGTGNDFPVTSWVADDPDPIDPADWSLSVKGLVDTPVEVSYAALAGDSAVLDVGATETAVLDCTSGWYAEREWRGVRLSDLLSAVDPDAAARWVTVRSVTGYRWSVKIDDAGDTLLATHVDGERLSHGHGAPLRLVLPGSRGFQWVKWVESVEVRRHEDLSRWIAIHVSGLG
jgi:DMSO/TMAO reductase YedYZ molybdopterin-dependent catalytic subunit